jgi:hypothetical protein
MEFNSNNFCNIHCVLRARLCVHRDLFLDTKDTRKDKEHSHIKIVHKNYRTYKSATQEKVIVVMLLGSKK